MTDTAVYTIELGTNSTSYTTDATGRVIAIAPDRHIAPEDVIQITRFDIEEYRTFWAARHPECLELCTIDGLDVGFWHLKDGAEVYEPAEAMFRYGWITGAAEDAACIANPTTGAELDQTDVERTVAVEIESTRYDVEHEYWEVCHEADKVTHFSVYIRVPDEENEFLLAHHVVDVARAEGSTPAVVCAKRIATLLQVPLIDNRTVLKDA
jgi:hypothetical protein